MVERKEFNIPIFRVVEVDKVLQELDILLLNLREYFLQSLVDRPVRKDDNRLFDAKKIKNVLMLKSQPGLAVRCEDGA